MTMLNVEQTTVPANLDSPTQRLMALWASVFYAALMDAASEYRSGRDEHFSKSLVWLLHDNREYPGSFLWLCDLFNVDPDNVRRHWRSKADTLGISGIKDISKQKKRMLSIADA